MPETKPRRALICDQDVVLRRTLGDLVAGAGFDIVAEASNVIQALQLAPGSKATLVVLTVESLALNPLEIIAELRQAEPGPEIILVSSDDSTRARALAVGAFDVTAYGDPEALEEAAAAVAEVLTTGEQRSRPERRAGRDRRERQDWSKVTSQRRSGDERRSQPRRAPGRDDGDRTGA